VYQPSLEDNLAATLSRLFKSTETDRLYSAIAHKYRKIADYWSSQIKRDLMHEGKAIPEPIILDRIKESYDTLEILHYLKLVIFISKEDKLVKSSYWKTSFLFSNYLFEDNIEIFVNLEKMFLSLCYITRAIKNNSNLSSENAKKYKLLLYSMFNSSIDLYNVTFDKLEQIRQQLVRKSKDSGVGTLQFLKSSKVHNFIQKSGTAEVLGKPSLSKDNVKNIKFFKILMYYSQEFGRFVRECASDLQSASSGDPIVQVFCILSQVTSEVEAIKVKEKNLKQLNEEIGTADGKKNPLYAVEIQPDEETLKRRAEREAKEKEQQDKLRKDKQAKSYQRAMGNHEVIIFDNEQDDEAGYQMKRSTGRKFDKKTQDYLDRMKTMQYNDEYDDTLEFDDNQKRKRE